MAENGPVGLEMKKMGRGRQARRWGCLNGGLGVLAAVEATGPGRGGGAHGLC